MNTTTRAQRINKRHDAIWERAQATKPYDKQGFPNLPDDQRLKKIARELSFQFRTDICNKASSLNVPSIKYKHQYLLEEVIADMKSFV